MPRWIGLARLARRALLTWRRRVRRPSGTPQESDVATDPAAATSRPTGGDPAANRGEEPTTTGPGENETFVGRVAGEDGGYDENTGAEARREGGRSGRRRGSEHR